MRSRPSGTDPDRDVVRAAWLTAAAIVGAALLVLAVGLCRAQAQDLPAVLERGQPAPAAGLLLGEDQAKRAVEEIRDARALAAQVETLKAALAAKEREAEKLTAALAVADQHRQLTAQLLDRYEKAMDKADQALARSVATLERAEKRIDSLESTQKWMMFGGVLALGLGFLLGAF